MNYGEAWDSSCTDIVGLLFALLGTTTKTKDQVECGLLLDVVVAEGAAVLELLASEDQALLVRWDSGGVMSEGG